MTRLYSLSSLRPALPSRFSVHLARALNGVDLTPHLVPLDDVQSGDLVGMMSRLRINPDEISNARHHLQSFFVQEPAGIKARWYDELVGPAKNHAARVMAEQMVLGDNLPYKVWNYKMVENTGPCQFSVVHFADAILYINDSWMHGELDDGYDDEEETALRPIVLEMNTVSKIDEIAACVHRTCQYLNTVRRTLSLELRDMANWNVALPPSSAYFSFEPDAFI